MNFIKAVRDSARGQKLLLQNRKQEALSLLACAARLCPDDPRIIVQYALGLMATGQEKEALNLLEAAREKAPGNHAVPLFLAILYYDTGRFEKSLPALEACLSTQPNNQLAKNYKALALFASGREKESLASIRSVPPEHNIGFLSRFCAFFEERIPRPVPDDESKRELQAEARDVPEKDKKSGSGLGYWAKRGLVRSAIKSLEKKDYSAAAGDFRFLLENDPQNVTATLGMIIALTELSRYEEARDLLLFYLDGRKDGPDPTLEAWLGRLYIFLGEYERGVRILRSVPSEGPDDYGVNYYLAVGYLFLRDRKKALFFFDRAFRFYFVDTLEDCLKPLLERLEKYHSLSGSSAP